MTIVALTAIAVLWPILFLIPGWVVVRRVAPDLPAPGAVGVAVVASVYLSAHLVDIVARFLGFGWPAIAGSVGSPRHRDDRLRPGAASLAGAPSPVRR